MTFIKINCQPQGITTIIPGDEDIEYINTAIYEEMGKGIFLPATKQKLLGIINSLIKKGAEGVVLGCTEIPLLIKQEDCPVPIFDTTKIHSMAAVDFALSDDNYFGTQLYIKLRGKGVKELKENTGHRQRYRSE